MVLNHVVFDLDDFAQEAERNCLSHLFRLKEKWSKLKVTLFAIPFYNGHDQTYYFQKVLEDHSDWIELGIHGWSHYSNFECMDWDYKKAKKKIKRAMESGVFSPVFKAPGWQISRDTYGVLKELDIICADHKFSAYTEPGIPNSKRRPAHLKVYEIDHPWMVHGHTWDCVGNGINQLMIGWEKQGYPWDDNSEFHFITELFND